MNKKSAFIFSNLSALTFIIIYMAYAIYHIAVDSFILSDQIGLLVIMLPFTLIGLAIDYILRRNATLENWIKVTAKLLPLGVFIMQLISTVYLYLGKESYNIFNYLIWLFVAAPFFIASYEKEGMRKRVTQAGMGTGLIIAVYLFLATQTDGLDTGYGSIAYFTSYFMMLFAVTDMKRFPYVSIGLGIVNAVFLILTRYVPLSSDTKLNGWDYNISSKIELLLIITLTISILLNVLKTSRTKAVKSV